MKRAVTGLGKLNWGKRACAVVVLCAATAIALPAQPTVGTFFNFDGTNGSDPYAGLVQATNGDLYGTTSAGGTNCEAPPIDNGCGTVFKIAPSGRLTTLYNFCPESGCKDGSGPQAGLVQATNGNLYGTTVNGGDGASAGGTVFEITPSGAFTTLYSFCSQGSFSCFDGEYPYAGLVQATNRDLYGTTSSGGAGGGTVFEITLDGVLTTLYKFCTQSGCPDGYLPEAGLVQAFNGDLYGTTESGGANGHYGTVFEMTPTGTLTTLYSFCSQSGCADGYNPNGKLVQASNGDLYGTTYFGGANSCGGSGCGTIFKITPGGTLTTVYSFCPESGCPDGTNPSSGLIQGTDGDLYGTTSGGGAHSDGTIFKITVDGTLTTVYAFCSVSGCADGHLPNAGLVQDTNGHFYGTTTWGGTSSACKIGANVIGCGTYFSLNVGLGTFVKTLPTSGLVGAAVKILGTDLTGATSVTFNGTPATFTVVRPSEITTTVPTGATTGSVHVVTPSGTLSSNVSFRVK